MIEVYVGRQGSGKTYHLTALALAAMRAGMPVVSNYVVDGGPGQQSTVVDDEAGLEPLYAAARAAARESELGCLLALTELGTLMPARLWARTTTFRLLSDLLQTRKSRIWLAGDCQQFDAMDKLLRENVAAVWECEVILPHPWRRDRSGVADPHTGRHRRRPWVMLARKVRPEHVNYVPGSGRRKVVKRRWSLFDESVARAYDSWGMRDRRDGGAEPQDATEERSEDAAPRSAVARAV